MAFFIGNSYSYAQQPFKTSCVSWCFHGFEPNTDPEPAIDSVGSLGFDGIQLMIIAASDLDSVWTTAKINRVRKRLADNRLELVSVVPFFPVVVDFGSNNPEKVKSSLANFKRCCQIAQQLGAKRIEIVGPFVSEFIDPANDFFNNPYFAYKIDSKSYRPGQKLTLQTPNTIEWEVIKKRLVNVLSQCSQLAKARGLTLVIEPHIHSFVADNNGFQLFWDAVKDPNIKLNADTGWGTQQCEYPPMIVHKMKKHLAIMQFRDVDNMTRDFVPMGKGVVDIDGTLKALRQINFTGYLSFEEVFMPTAKEDAVRFMKLVKGKPGEIPGK